MPVAFSIVAPLAAAPYAATVRPSARNVRRMSSNELRSWSTRGAEVGEELEPIEAGGTLGIDAGEDMLGGGVVVSEVPPIRSAVQVGEVLDVVEVQPVPLGERLDRQTRVVEEVLVVDRVERAAVDQVPHARVLDGDQAVVGEEVGHAGHEVVGVGNVGHHVVGDDDVGRHRARHAVACAASRPKNSSIVSTPIARAASA